MLDYRIQSVEDKFEIQERKAGSRDHFYTTYGLKSIEGKDIKNSFTSKEQAAIYLEDHKQFLSKAEKEMREEKIRQENMIDRVTRHCRTSEQADTILLKAIKLYCPTVPGLDLERFDQLVTRCERIGLADSIGWGSISVNYTRGNGVDVALYIRLKRTGRKKCTDGRVDFYEFEFELNWSSTSRPLVTALAAANLYKEVAELAAILQVAAGDRTIADIQRETPQQIQPTLTAEASETAKKCITCDSILPIVDYYSSKCPACTAAEKRERERKDKENPLDDAV